MADKISTAEDEAGEYRVLARKYRPSDFTGLIGQDAMVRTLTNAFDSGRIAQAYMLTGVRGVGKTTTARILARALNYTGADGKSGPTVKMKELGEHCQAIMESRHIDVVEMDAASHTGIDDIREIIEAVKYKPASARYKVYIIDEVHMLSRQAFNGLLKTLEEPPEHVKFIFATTEIRKVPVTVLSRCQRFDLHRVSSELLISHFAGIVKSEGVKAEEEALAMIARAAEGSVRDGLSLLDQAIALGQGMVKAEHISDMLGLADRSRVIGLFDHVMHGRAGEALDELKTQYDAGADPALVLTDMAGFIHFVTRLKVAGDEAGRDPTKSETEITRGREMAAGLDMRTLARAWQMTLKGIEEVRAADKPLNAADMVLVRMAYASELPPPEEIVRNLENRTDSPGGKSRPGTGSEQRPAPVARIEAASPVSFEEVVELAAKWRDLRLKSALERNVRLVHFEPGKIELQLDGAPRGLPGELSARLKEWTGETWMVAVSSEKGSQTLAENRNETKARQLEEAGKEPVVKAVMATFPGAKITAVRKADAVPEKEKYKG